MALLQSSLSLSQVSMRSLLNGHLNTGVPIMVSIEPNLLALARGYILELNPEEVVIDVEHVLNTASLKDRVQRTRSAEDDDVSELVFRIGKDEFFGSNNFSPGKSLYLLQKKRGIYSNRMRIILLIYITVMLLLSILTLIHQVVDLCDST